MKKKFKKSNKKKSSVKPEVISAQNTTRRSRDKDEVINKKRVMLDNTPPANLFAVNINEQKQFELEIKRMVTNKLKVAPKKSEIHKISSERGTIQM